MTTGSRTRAAAADHLHRESLAAPSPEPHARALKTSYSFRFLALFSAAVIAVAAAFVVHLALRFETVRLGYEVGEARREQRQLVEQARLLAIEAATLRQAARIEAVARGVLGMEVPEPDRIVPIDAKASRRSAGRVR